MDKIFLRFASSPDAAIKPSAPHGNIASIEASPTSGRIRIHALNYDLRAANSDYPADQVWLKDTNGYDGGPMSVLRTSSSSNIANSWFEVSGSYTGNSTGTWYVLNKTLAGYNIQGSSDGIAWNTLVDVNDNYQITRVHNFDVVDVRYLRLNVTDANRMTLAAFKDTAYLYEFLAFESRSPLDPPTAPTQTIVADVTSGSITLGWNAAAGTVEDYRIYWSETPTQPVTHQASVAGNLTSFTATGLSPETEYFFWITARNSGGESGAATVSATTLELLPPDAPTGLALSGQTANGLTVSWQDNADNETVYNVYWSTTNSRPSSPNQVLSANSTSTLVDALTPDTRYYFWVTASNTAGVSSAAVTNGHTTDFEGSLAIGLRSRWKFDELSGTTAFDTESFNDGDFAGNITRSTEAIAGQSITLDGNDDWIAAPHQAEYSGSALSISMWVRPSVADSQPRGLISKRQGLSANQRCFSIFTHTDSMINIDIGSQRITTDYSLNDVNVWKHLTLVYDGTAASDHVTLYVDGQEFASHVGTTTSIPQLNCPITIGILNADYGFGFAGEIDEVRIYDRPLTSDEVLALYQSEPSTETSTPKNFAEWTARTLSDVPLADQGPLADPDFDGLSNLAEYGLQSVPTDSHSTFLPTAMLVDQDGSKYLQFSFRRISGGSDDTLSGYSAGGLRYTIQVNQTLALETWTTGSNYLKLVGDPVDNGNHCETVTVQLKAPIGSTPSYFIRLKIDESE